MKTQHLAQALIKLCEESTPDEASRKFLNFAKKKNLLSFLPRIIFYLKTEDRKQRERNTFKILSSHELSEETKNQIKKMVSVPKSVPEAVQINTDLIGGFIAEYNNSIYDASLSYQLKRLSEFLRG